MELTARFDDAFWQNYFKLSKVEILDFHVEYLVALDTRNQIFASFILLYKFLHFSIICHYIFSK